MEHNRPVIERIDGPIVTFTLNRENQHNAFTPEMVEALTDSFTRAGNNNDFRVIILTGSGRTFCAGADLSAMKEASNFSFDENLKDAEAIFDLMYAIDSCPHPVVGRINGSAIGGGVGLVSCCDVAVAVDRARFGLSEVRLGLVPAVISPFVISRIGHSNARELFLTGERFDAQKAKEIGLLHHVTEETRLDEKVDEVIQELLKSAPEAVATAKRLIQFASGRSKEELRSYTTRLIAERRSSDEGQEGLSAYLEKREPWWREPQ